MPTSALLVYLEANHGGYFEKLEELRLEVDRWLAYVPSTFPHYTQHTTEHSDEIIHAMSNLLFHDGSIEPSTSLSGAEAYIAAAAAYLHDIGMVVSEAEKQELLASEEWTLWVTENDAAREWLAVVREL